MMNFERITMPARSYPLADGDAGVNQTVRAMRRLIENGKKDPAIRALAARIITTAGVPAYDAMGEARAIGEAVHRNIRFTRDVYNVETLHGAREIVELGIGDCDDFTVLIGSLLATIGHNVRIVTVSNHAEDPAQFSHVYPEVEIDGQWIPVDFARRNPQFGKGPESYFRKRVYSLNSDQFADVSGYLNGLGHTRRMRPRLGNLPNALPGAYNLTALPQYRHLRGSAPVGVGHYGKPALSGVADTIAELITAGGGAAANIISATKFAPTTPMYTAPPAVSGTITGGISTNILVLGGLALAAVFLISQRGR